MRTLVILGVLFLICIVCSCKTENKGIQTNDLQYIHLLNLPIFNPFIDNNRLDSIKIVKLTTDTNCLLGGIIKVIIEDSLIFIRDANQKLLVFDLEGNFQNSIGTMGHGPLDYTSLSDFYINSQEKFVCILDIVKGKFYRYTFDGQFLKEFNSDLRVFNNAIDIHYVGEGQLLVNMNEHPGSLYNYALVNEDNYTLKRFLQPYPVLSHENISNIDLPTVTCKDGFNFNTALMSDTIYSVRNGQWMPICVYEGELKHITQEAIQNEGTCQGTSAVAAKLERRGYSKGLRRLFQLKDYLYFEICQKGECWNVFWNYKNGTGFKYNSCLPGPRVFPGKIQTVYENYIVRSISALDLKTEYFRKHNFKDSRIDAVSREVLEDDNPVLLFYYVNTQDLKSR